MFGGREEEAAAPAARRRGKGRKEVFVSLCRRRRRPNASSRRLEQRQQQHGRSVPPNSGAEKPAAILQLSGHAKHSRPEEPRHRGPLLPATRAGGLVLAQRRKIYQGPPALGRLRDGPLHIGGTREEGLLQLGATFLRLGHALHGVSLSLSAAGVGRRGGPNAEATSRGTGTARTRRERERIFCRPPRSSPPSPDGNDDGDKSERGKMRRPRRLRRRRSRPRLLLLLLLLFLPDGRTDDKTIDFLYHCFCTLVILRTYVRSWFRSSSNKPPGCNKKRY